MSNETHRKIKRKLNFPLSESDRGRILLSIFVPSARRSNGMAFWDITNVSVLARLQRNDDDIARNGVLGTRRAQSGLQLAPGTHDVAWEWCFGKMHRDSGQEFHTFQRYDFFGPSLARTKRT